MLEKRSTIQGRGNGIDGLASLLELVQREGSCTAIQNEHRVSDFTEGESAVYRTSFAILSVVICRSYFPFVLR